MSLINDYTLGIELRQRTAELHEIAALDRLAGELAPESALRRYARQHQSGRRGLGAWIRRAVERSSHARPGVWGARPGR